jgi:hypothetical protein
MVSDALEFLSNGRVLTSRVQLLLRYPNASHFRKSCSRGHATTARGVLLSNLLFFFGLLFPQVRPSPRFVLRI